MQNNMMAGPPNGFYPSQPLQQGYPGSPQQGFFGAPQPGYGGAPQPGYPGYGFDQPTPMGRQPPTGGFQRQYGGLAQLLENNHDGIFIKQQFDALGAFTGRRPANTYSVFEGSTDPGRTGLRPVLTCNQMGDFSACCGIAACRRFEVTVFNNLSPTQEGVLILDNPSTCACLCFDRPEMSVYYIENSNHQLLGKVVNSWDLSNYSFKIVDTNGAARYSIKTNSCQCSIWCNCPCDSCESTHFEVWSANHERLVTSLTRCGPKVDHHQKLSGGIDQFSLPFPAGATWQDKSLLLAATLMIDFMMFEVKDLRNPDVVRGDQSL